MEDIPAPINNVLFHPKPPKGHFFHFLWTKRTFFDENNSKNIVFVVFTHFLKEKLWITMCICELKTGLKILRNKGF